jgi:hypothetical protein
MDSNKDNSNTSCGPDCSCNAKSGMPLHVKIILLIVIVAVAGAVLAGSLAKKSRAAAKPSTGYSVAAFTPQAPSAVPPKDSSLSSAADTHAVSFVPLPSLSALNTVALDVEGVFILMINGETEKTPGIVKEIGAAKKAIASRGTRMGVFQLASGTPDFAMLSAQVKPPAVVVVLKGKGMRGVQGADINETKLLQAYMAALQPTGCCPAGGKRVCK